MSSHHHGLKLHGAAAGAAGCAGVGATEHHEHVIRHLGVNLATFSEPMEQAGHAAWWQAIPVGAGWTVNLIVLVAVLCVALLGISALTRMAVTRCSN